MSTIVLKKIVCLKTEDIKTDELYLNVYVNGDSYNNPLSIGSRKLQESSNMSKGDVWELKNKTLDFSTIRIALFDKDGDTVADHDDCLGALTISMKDLSKAEEKDKTFEFNLQGAKYVLYYDVKKNTNGCDAYADLYDIKKDKRSYRQITDFKIKCLKSYESRSEIRTEFYVDGNPHSFSLKEGIKKGTEWSIDLSSLKFSKTLLVKLFEEDTKRSYDDYVGKFYVNTKAGTYTETIKSGEGNFTITYTVKFKSRGIYRPMCVESELDSFKKDFYNSTTKEWKNSSCWALSSEFVYNTCKEITADSRMVLQSGYGMCGATAVTYVLAKRFPAYFVKICHELYKTGSFTARETIKASKRLMAYDFPAGDLGSCNWMFQATLIDHFMCLIVSASTSTYSTYDPFIKNAGMAILMYDDYIERDTTAIDSKMISNMEEVDKLASVKNAGNENYEKGASLLLINSNLVYYLRGKSVTNITRTPDHWVTYVKDFYVNKDHTKAGISLFSWGNIESRSDMDFEIFDNHLSHPITFYEKDC